MVSRTNQLILHLKRLEALSCSKPLRKNHKGKDQDEPYKFKTMAAPIESIQGQRTVCFGFTSFMLRNNSLA